MPIPASVLTNLVVIETCLAFAGLEGLLDGPAGSGGPGEGGEGDSFGSVGQVVGGVGRVGQAASGQEPVLGVGVACTVDACPGPAVAAIVF